MSEKIIHRVFHYLEETGELPTRFERRCELTIGYLSKILTRSSDMGETSIVKIIVHNPKLNPIWLLLGEGNMLKDSCYSTDSELIDEAIDKMNEAQELVKKLYHKNKKATD